MLKRLLPSPAAVVAAAAATVLALAGIGFVCAALYLWLASLASPQVAALASGGILLAGALLLALLAWLAERHAGDRRAAPGSDDPALQAGKLLAEALAGSARDHPFASSAAALAAGLAVGASPEIRRELAAVLAAFARHGAGDGGDAGTPRES